MAGSPQLKQGSIACTSPNGLMAASPSMNREQLHSLGCGRIGGGTKYVRVIDEAKYGVYQKVAMTMETEVFTYWVDYRDIQK